MDYLRKYLWLWVIIAVIFACGIISIIFFFINKCISRRGKHRISQLQRRSPDFTVESNKYQETGLKINTPPLPPRTQFLTAESQSYENLAEVPECQNIPDYEEDNHDYEEAVPDYEQDKHDYEQAMPDYEQDKHDYEQAVPDYEQDKHDYEQAMPNYEQAMAEQSDYVKVEDEEVILPPPYMDQDQAEDNTSTEDYDDIADANHSEEDYDDVG
ncbi:chromosomal replication initiator protein DnaA-like isoform X1 [Etheostoma cragini]|uniref:chromosomal replication initiator protein DnaA-like isoform X1 n=1 Tax=Etheostoma cragini TaxID=417921 RepID=UPI00155E54D7|nr:chromosomal replication initiator protein DnaA-like isoform X1 [Etheostoma cragini]